MGIRNFEVISIAPGTGSQTANVSTTASKVAIPTMENGDLPKFLYCIAMEGTAGNAVFIMPTNDTNGDSVTGFPLFVDNPIGIIINVHGYSHIGTDATGGSDSTLYLYPLEDF
jgi:hypothetical protein